MTVRKDDEGIYRPDLPTGNSNIPLKRVTGLGGLGITKGYDATLGIPQKIKEERKKKEKRKKKKK